MPMRYSELAGSETNPGHRSGALSHSSSPPNGEVAQLKVITYEELTQEERNDQVASALLVGVAAAGNAMSASQAGYYNSTTVYGPRGAYTVNTTGYSPAAAGLAQSNAAAQNDAMISATIAQGRA